MRSVLFSVATFSWLLACGSSSSEPQAVPAVPGAQVSAEPVVETPPASNQKPVEKPVEPTGAPATVTPASAFPTVVSSGGNVVAAPKVMPIYFDGYALRAELDRFHQSYATSTHWLGAVGEYGVGAMTLRPSVTRTDAATSSVTDDQIKGWLQANLGEGKLLGVPDADTAYVLYYPARSTISLQGSESCSSFGGYHSELATSDGNKVGYAVIPTCDQDSLYTASDHEMVEWATDRFPYTAQAYANLTPEFAAFGLIGGAEISDICTFLERTQAQALGSREIGYIPEDLGFRVQRHFSNKASQAGHFPCAPNYDQTFLVGVPQLSASTSLGRGGKTSYMSIRGGAGEIKIKIHSDKAVAQPWRIFAQGLSFGGATARMKISLDKTRVLPGDEVTLTVSNSKETQAGILLVTSAPDGSAAHSWPILAFAQ